MGHRPVFLLSLREETTWTRTHARAGHRDARAEMGGGIHQPRIAEGGWCPPEARERPGGALLRAARHSWAQHMVKRVLDITFPSDGFRAHARWGSYFPGTLPLQIIQQL